MQQTHQKEINILHNIEFNPKSILKIKQPTENELDLALDLNPELALHYKYISEELQGFIVEKNPENIKYIADPTYKIERYVVYRGYLDFRNGDYYWKLTNKKPQNLLTLLQIHPVLGGIPLRIAIPTIFFYFKIKQVLIWINRRRK